METKYLKDFFEELGKLQNKYPDKDVVALVKFEDNNNLRYILVNAINNNERMQERVIIALIDYYIETNQIIDAEYFTEKLDKNQGNFLFECAKISYKKNDIKKTEEFINSLLNNKEKVKSIQNKEELFEFLGKAINNNELLQERVIIALIDYYIETNQIINAEYFTEKLDENQGNFLFECAKISYKKNDMEETEYSINLLLNNKEKIKSIQNKEELFEFYLDFSLKKIEQLKKDEKSINEMIAYLSTVVKLIDNIELTEQEFLRINNAKNKDNINVIDKLKDILLGKAINNNEPLQERVIIALIDYYIETNQIINAKYFTKKLDENQGNFLFECAKISYKKNDIKKTEYSINLLLNNKEKVKSIQNKEELFEFYLDFSLKKIEQLKNDGKSIDEMITYLSTVGELIDNIELTEQECSRINNTKNKDNLNVINNFENKISECLDSKYSILPDKLLKAFFRKGDNMSAGFYVNKNIFDTPENKVKKIEELYDNNFENFKNKTLILLYFQNCIKLENLDHQKIDTISQIMIDKISNGEISQSETERAVVRTVEGDKVTLDTVEQHKEMFETLFLFAGKEEGYLDSIITKKQKALNERLEKTENDLEAEQEEIVINNGTPL